MNNHITKYWLLSTLVHTEIEWKGFSYHLLKAFCPSGSECARPCLCHAIIALHELLFMLLKLVIVFVTLVCRIFMNCRMVILTGGKENTRVGLVVLFVNKPRLHTKIQLYLSLPRFYIKFVTHTYALQIWMKTSP